MSIDLSDREKEMLLGATLMHWGVPFQSVTKRVLKQEEQLILDTMSDRLTASRRGAGASSPLEAESPVNFSRNEQLLLSEVLKSCLEECGTNMVEIHLHLKANTKSEVELLISRIDNLQ